MKFNAFVGIGSNMGNPTVNCEKAIGLLYSLPGIQVIARSSLYESEPVGGIDQDWFINAAVALRTDLNPEELLHALLKIEHDLGRQRREKWGPRIIDLDLLTYDDRVMHSPALTLPHPEMIKRRFVLLPLSEFSGGYKHPIEKKTIHSLLKELPDSPSVKK